MLIGSHRTTSIDDHGRPLVHKRATTPEAATRLGHEAAMLELLAHPGVVELVAFDRDGAGATLTTIDAGRHSLATIGVLTEEQIAGLVAAVADTLADLHERGLVHGRVEASHVVVGPDGRPRLCGLAATAAAGESREPADDVHALGTMLLALLRDGDDAEPIPDTRFGRRRSQWSGYHRRALLTIGDQATADDPDARPAARMLAASIRASVPGACLGPGAVATGPTTTRDRQPEADPFERLRPVMEEGDDDGALRRWSPRAAVAIGALAGLALIGLGVATLRGGERPTLAEPAPTAPCQVVPAGALAADVDGDGCDDEIAIAAGVLRVGGERFRLGQPGDQVVIGDWDCDGDATPGLVRPDTGEVFLFHDWATPGDDLIVGALPQLAPPGRALAEDGDGDGCSSLVVETPAAGRVQVWPQPPAGEGEP